MSRSCYLVGKGEGIDSFEWNSGLPKVGINDVGLYIDCDYGICGPDEVNRDWLEGTDILDKVKAYWAPDRIWAPEGVKRYICEKHIAHVGGNKFLWRQRTSVAGLSLCKELGFSRVILVGFCDSFYARPWRTPLRERDIIVENNCKNKKISRGQCDDQAELLIESAKDLKIEIVIV